MGCAGSRLTDAAAREAVPEKIRPLLRRRFEELKRCGRASVLRESKTLSKKELLKHGTAPSDDDEETTEGDVRGSSVRSARVVPVSPKRKDKETVSDKKDEEIEDESEKLKVVADLKVDSDEGKCNEEDEDEEEAGEDGGRLSCLDESMICPGSPSFRIYCINLPEDDSEDEEKDAETNKELGTDNKDKSNEKSTTKTENRKTKIGMRFRKVLPKISSSGKNIFGFKSGCRPGCMSHHRA